MIDTVFPGRAYAESCRAFAVPVLIADGVCHVDSCDATDLAVIGGTAEAPSDGVALGELVDGTAPGRRLLDCCGHQVDALVTELAAEAARIPQQRLLYLMAGGGDGTGIVARSVARWAGQVPPAGPFGTAVALSPELCEALSERTGINDEWLWFGRLPGLDATSPASWAPFFAGLCAVPGLWHDGPGMTTPWAAAAAVEAWIVEDRDNAARVLDILSGPVGRCSADQARLLGVCTGFTWRGPVVGAGTSVDLYDAFCDAVVALDAARGAATDLVDVAVSVAATLDGSSPAELLAVTAALLA